MNRQTVVHPFNRIVFVILKKMSFKAKQGDKSQSQIGKLKMTIGKNTTYMKFYLYKIMKRQNSRDNKFVCNYQDFGEMEGGALRWWCILYDYCT